MPRKKSQQKLTNWKSMNSSKINAKKEVYRNASLSQKMKKKTNKQPKLTP